MKSTKILLLSALLLTGVTCGKDSAFVYSSLGGEAILPCTKQNSSGCSSISWTFYRGGRYIQAVNGGQVNVESDKSSRLSVTSNCSLSIMELKVSDAGSYVCLDKEDPITDVYLSLLAITSHSTITDLQPGGNLILSCVLFTYFDAGSCRSYSSGFTLHWLTEDGAKLLNSSRITMLDTRCNITVVMTLQEEDDNRKWTCQVDSNENSRAAFLDIRSKFLFQNTQTAPSPEPSVATMTCPAQLPISRIVLCAALPVMVIIVGLFTWRLDRRRAKKSAASIELEIMK